jgi:hypothetical protein
MKIIAIIFAMVAALVFCRATRAEQTASAITAKDWTPICAPKTTNQMDRMYCQAYARGVSDGLKLWRAAQPDGAEVCIPENVSERQLIDVTSDYIRRNPKVGPLRIAAVLGLAFLEAWPCK